MESCVLDLHAFEEHKGQEQPYKGGAFLSEVCAFLLRRESCYGSVLDFRQGKHQCELLGVCRRDRDTKYCIRALYRWFGQGV